MARKNIASIIYAGRWLGGPALAALLLSRPREAAAGAARAMADWHANVAPALFPFLALLPLLTCDAAARAYESLLGRAMRALFRLPGAAAPAFVVGMLGGSPAGALAARRLAASSGMDRGQLRRVAASVAGLSPAYLLSGVGAGLLGSAALGRTLLISQVGAQLATALLLRGAWRDDTAPVPPPADRADEQPVRAAVLSALTVCGTMALFAALAGAARAWIGPAADALLCALDLPSGARIVAATAWPLPTKLLLLSAMIGFGGVCIGAQNLAALAGCGVKAGEYFALRLLAAAIGAGLTWAQLRLPPNGMPAAVHAPLPVSALAVAALAVPVLLRLRLNISRRAGVENSASPAPEPPHVVAGFACRTPEVKSVKSKIFA